MLRLQNINLCMNKQQLLNNINLVFENSKVYGLLGPNGSGKTTLFKTILGLTQSSGSILFHENSDKIKIGSLIEYPGFYENLTVYENMLLHLRYLKLDQRMLEAVLSKVGLWENREKKFSSLSLGMKQRLGIAKAIIGNPAIIILDEPTNGLDPISIKEVRNLIKKELVNDKNCVIVSSHNLNEIAVISDELIFINKGEIVRQIENHGFDEKKLEDIYENIIKGE